MRLSLGACLPRSCSGGPTQAEISDDEDGAEMGKVGPPLASAYRELIGVAFEITGP